MAIITHHVPMVRQYQSPICWVACAAMILSYRTRSSVTVESLIGYDPGNSSILNPATSWGVMYRMLNDWGITSTGPQMSPAVSYIEEMLQHKDSGTHNHRYRDTRCGHQRNQYKYRKMQLFESVGNVQQQRGYFDRATVDATPVASFTAFGGLRFRLNLALSRLCRVRCADHVCCSCDHQATVRPSTVRRHSGHASLPFMPLCEVIGRENTQHVREIIKNRAMGFPCPYSE